MQIFFGNILKQMTCRDKTLNNHISKKEDLQRRFQDLNEISGSKMKLI